jgi:hypothetical protein
MKMKTIRLKTALTDDEMKPIIGAKLTERHFDTLITEDTDVYTPEGALLLRFRKNQIPNNLCRIAYDTLRVIKMPPTNRGIAGLGQSIPYAVKRDGTRSKTRHMTWEMLKQFGLRDSSSAVIGFMDRYARFPYCRACAFNLKDPGAFKRVTPFIQVVSDLFAKHVPDRFAAQKDYVARINKDFTIPKTVFTTVTVNNNWQSTVHTDSGDFAGGFGVLTALRAGHYTGGYLVLPRYKVAVDIHTTDILFYNVHEWHGNSPFFGIKKQYERVSCVFYARTKMVHCGSAKQELARVKARKEGEPLYDEKPSKKSKPGVESTSR